MPCFKPVDAIQLADGKVKVYARHGNDVRRELKLPCGNCEGCLLKRAQMWSIRCMHEASLYANNSFVTLTYDDEHLPENGCLRYRDFQLFMKRLRLEFGPTRFYCAGEYGSRTDRPHYHALLFGLWFNDYVPYKRSASGFQLYESADLTRLWGQGSASFGSVTMQSASYCARYTFKKVETAMERKRVNLDSGEVYDRVPEFCHMSLRPGIGKHWYDKYKSDAFPKDYLIMQGGHKAPVPLYYRNLLRLEDGLLADSLDFHRECAALERVSENSPARLAAREIVQHASLRALRRSNDSL